MIKVYQSAAFAPASLIKSILETNGIRSVLRNTLLNQQSGGVPNVSMWPEVWVLDDENFDLARKLIVAFETPIEQTSWACTKCGEENEGNFDACWKCGHSK